MFVLIFNVWFFNLNFCLRIFNVLHWLKIGDMTNDEDIYTDGVGFLVLLYGVVMAFT